MSLIRCTECGNPVSDRAAVCPRCGCYPVSEDSGEENTPIVSPWSVYICGSSGKLRMFFFLFSVLMGSGLYWSYTINSWACMWIFSSIGVISFFLAFAVPSMKTSIAMIIASKITMNSQHEVEKIIDQMQSIKDSNFNKEN